MIRRESFCNKIRDLGFSFKRQADRVCFYKRASDQLVMTVPRRDQLDDLYVKRELLKAGCSQAEAEAFISQYKSATQ